MHINIQSITQSKSNSQKLAQIESLIGQTKPDIISQNEAFLKTRHLFSIDGYKIIRADRYNFKGWGSALCNKDNLVGKEIIIETELYNDNVVGLQIETTNKKVVIFSIYSPPKSHLNLKLVEYIHSTFEHFIILGDINANNKTWNCTKDNIKGIGLERLCDNFNIHVFNCKAPTYLKAKSILDLSLCSNSLIKYFGHH